jgi:hypothetical protein
MLLYCFTLVFVRVERRSTLPAPPGSDADDEGLAAGLREVELSNGSVSAARLPTSPPPGNLPVSSRRSRRLGPAPSSPRSAAAVEFRASPRSRSPCRSDGAQLPPIRRHSEVVASLAQPEFVDWIGMLKILLKMQFLVYVSSRHQSSVQVSAASVTNWFLCL